jgi:hypothetical protein
MPKYGSKYGSSLPKAAELQGSMIFGHSEAEDMSAMVRFVGVGQPARQLIRCAMR